MFSNIPLIFNRATFVRMKGQGIRLRTYLVREGIKFVAAANRLGVHVNTLHNWMRSDRLELPAFEKLVRSFPDIMEEFPEVEWKKVSTVQHTPDASYLNAADAECRRQLQEVSERYTRLLERYNSLLEKHVELQARVGGQ